MPVHLKKENCNVRGIYDRCENDTRKRCNFDRKPSCTAPSINGRRQGLFSCDGKTFTQITPAEFHASTGKKWRVKKDGTVIPYEE